MRKDRLLELFPREAEVPFDSDRKRMTTVHRVASSAGDATDGAVKAALRQIAELDGDHIAFTKRAADSVLEACQYVWDDGEPKPINEALQQRIQAANEQLAASGMRVLGVAFRPLDVEQVVTCVPAPPPTIKPAACKTAPRKISNKN